MRTMRLFAVACCAVMLAVQHATAQDAPNRFTFTVAGGAVKGVEDYTLEKTPEGHALHGKVRVEQGGATIELTHDASFGPDWVPTSYRLQVSTPAGAQTLTAQRSGDAIDIRAAAGGQGKSQSVPVRPHTVLLDNTIFSHYQALLDAVAASGPDGEWWAIVPQVFMGLAGRIRAGGDDTGLLKGERVALRKYTLELGPTLVDFWAEAASNRLMRVSVPVQKAEAVREGFAPAPPVAAPAPARLTARTVTFPSAGFDMPATVTLPAAPAGRVPVVILVHGSGPNDRDETIGPNKPFRDLAEGLAAAGIGTLRYDKRTFAFRERMSPAAITVEEEVLQDAVEALAYARSLPEADPARIFLLGHSLGATLAPFIAARAPAVRGVIMLAPAMRPLDEVILAQTADRLRDMGQAEADVAATIGEMQKQFARVRSGEARDTEMVLGASARYWRDLRTRDTASALAALKMPVLVLQGAEDIQVTKADYDLVRRAVAGEPPARRELHWLAGLNHLFMKTEGRSTGAEYGRASHVDPAVIQLIADWIHTQR